MFTEEHMLKALFKLVYCVFPDQPMLSEEELSHLEQASAVATEVTSSMLKTRLELEEKRKAMGLLQTALVSVSAGGYHLHNCHQHRTSAVIF